MILSVILGQVFKTEN